MSNDVREITAENQWLTYSRVDGARKQTEATVLMEPDLANGTVLSLDIRVDANDTWRTIRKFAAADLTAGEYLTYNLAITGEWQVRFGCATGGFGAGDTPEIILRIKPW